MWFRLAASILHHVMFGRRHAVTQHKTNGSFSFRYRYLLNLLKHSTNLYSDTSHRCLHEVSNDWFWFRETLIQLIILEAAVNGVVFYWQLFICILFTPFISLRVCWTRETTVHFAQYCTTAPQTPASKMNVMSEDLTHDLWKTAFILARST